MKRCKVFGKMKGFFSDIWNGLKECTVSIWIKYVEQAKVECIVVGGLLITLLLLCVTFTFIEFLFWLWL